VAARKQHGGAQEMLAFRGQQLLEHRDGLSVVHPVPLVAVIAKYERREHEVDWGENIAGERHRAVGHPLVAPATQRPE
jgi:hypothetical protein